MISQVGKANVGRIAERIVANELEIRGFSVSDLNRDRVAANADLIAVGHGVLRQIQVKASANTSEDVDKGNWRIGYGHCSQAQLDGTVNHFNNGAGAYRADWVVLVAVHSLVRYRCIVLPIDLAEKAVSLNIAWHYGTPKKSGLPKKPGKLWTYLYRTPGAYAAMPAFREEQSLLKDHADVWSRLVA